MVTLYVKHFSVLWFQVQSKVNMKYDTWHKEILSKFASRLGDNMQDFYGSVSKVIFCLLYKPLFTVRLSAHCISDIVIISCWYLDIFMNTLSTSVWYFRPVLIWSSKRLKEPRHLMLLGSSLLCSHWRESWRTGRRMLRSEMFPSHFHTVI